MSIIYVIRHAQASFGNQNYDQLSPLGYKQAVILSDYLRAIGIKFYSFYLGQHKRHAQTLEAYQKLLINDGQIIPVRQLAVFNEFDYEMVLQTIIPVLIKEDSKLTKDVDVMLSDNRIFQRVFERAIIRWLEQPSRFPGLESWSSFSQRVQKEMYSILNEIGPGKNLAIFTSGGVISAMIQGAINLSDKNTLKLSWQINNASITQLKYHKHKLILSGFNDISFLKISSNKGLVTYR